MFVAVNARELFDQVFFERDVETISRGLHIEVARAPAEFEVEAAQYLARFVGRELDPEHFARMCEPQRDRFAFRQSGDCFSHRTCITATDFLNEQRCPFERASRVPEVDATLEPEG